ncbi:MAG TPA: hypothetical protein VFE84_05230 [Patescibacteria group bacterium]|jgi:hypothetical protein|nr:hypothetical protein [Patescibacteria group bacterium]
MQLADSSFTLPTRWRLPAGWKGLSVAGIILLTMPRFDPVAAQTSERPDRPISGLLRVESAPLSFRVETLEATRSMDAVLDSASFSLPGQAQVVRQALLGRYRSALERESRRFLEKNPSLLQTDATEVVDGDGNPRRGQRRDATRIFQGANNRVLSEILEDALDDTVSLRRARAFLDGVRFDVMSGGRMRMGSAAREEPARTGAGQTQDSVAASFGLIVIGHPRLEMRTELPGGVRARIEVPLASPGIRATLSRRITSNLRGTLSAGVEDSGSERWISAGMAVRF